MAPHSKAALDMVAAAGALFEGDAQRYNELLRRLQDARNYAENLELDDTDPVMPAPADIILAALIAITRLAYADVSEDDSDEDIATRACDLLTSVELDLVDRSPDEPMERGSREEMLLKLWSCPPPDPRLADELQWGTLEEFEQFMENHPGQAISSTFDITQPGGQYYGFKLHQTPQVVSENNGPDNTELADDPTLIHELATNPTLIHELGEFQNANPYRLIEVDRDFRYRVVQPGEARPGTVEVIFLPDKPPGQQYRLRPVPYAPDYGPDVPDIPEQVETAHVQAQIIEDQAGICYALLAENMNADPSLTKITEFIENHPGQPIIPENVRLGR